jgi:hypothetical protein
LVRKYPQFNIEETKKQIRRYYLNEPVGINFTILGEKTFRAITKSAVNFIFIRKEVENILQSLIILKEH